ncbi:MAG TPA: DUF2334 domain-containing protein [Verrucomicrobiae bacterium]|jgi:hypothetical protein
MRYVILRDDDTNAFTPVECLERLYRPFLERGLPVNLAVIPNVRTDVTSPEGCPEGFLSGCNHAPGHATPIGSHEKLVRYLLDNPGYHVAQHGYHHEAFEFDRPDAPELRRRLEHGSRLLIGAGFAKPQTFVAPHDRLSRAGWREVARQFRVFSTGWFEWRRVPGSLWPGYLLKKALRRQHWRAGRTIFLNHPGCLLSRRRPYASMLEAVKQSIASRRLTVLVTHWWEYFPGRPDEAFIGILHQVANHLAGESDAKVVSFDDVAAGRVPLN